MQPPCAPQGIATAVAGETTDWSFDLHTAIAFWPSRLRWVQPLENLNTGSISRDIKTQRASFKRTARDTRPGSRAYRRRLRVALAKIRPTIKWALTGRVHNCPDPTAKAKSFLTFMGEHALACPCDGLPTDIHADSPYNKVHQAILKIVSSENVMWLTVSNILRQLSRQFSPDILTAHKSYILLYITESISVVYCADYIKFSQWQEAANKFASHWNEQYLLRVGATAEIKARQGKRFYVDNRVPGTEGPYLGEATVIRGPTNMDYCTIRGLEPGHVLCNQLSTTSPAATLCVDAGFILKHEGLDGGVLRTFSDAIAYHQRTLDPVWLWYEWLDKEVCGGEMEERVASDK